MKLVDHLSEDEKKRLQQIKKRKKKRKKKKLPKDPLKQKLSIGELKELMGVNRDRYERRGGAIRRK